MSNEKFFVLAFLVLLSLLGLWGIIASIFDSNSKMTPSERKKHQKEKQEKLKKEYEEKKALSVQKTEERRKENEKKLIEKKKIAKERKLKFLNWFKPNETIKNGITTPKKNIVEKPINSFLGSKNREPNSLDEKMDNLIKELKDL